MMESVMRGVRSVRRGGDLSVVGEVGGDAGVGRWDFLEKGKSERREVLRGFVYVYRAA